MAPLVQKSHDPRGNKKHSRQSGDVTKRFYDWAGGCLCLRLASVFQSPQRIRLCRRLGDSLRYLFGQLAQALRLPVFWREPNFYAPLVRAKPFFAEYHTFNKTRFDITPPMYVGGVYDCKSYREITRSTRAASGILNKSAIRNTIFPIPIPCPRADFQEPANRQCK